MWFQYLIEWHTYNVLWYAAITVLLQMIVKVHARLKTIFFFMQLFLDRDERKTY